MAVVHPWVSFHTPENISLNTTVWHMVEKQAKPHSRRWNLIQLYSVPRDLTLGIKLQTVNNNFVMEIRYKALLVNC